MNSDDFRDAGHRMVDWIADYLDSVQGFPVRAQTRPGDILAALPKEAPEDGEDMKAIMADVDRLIMPGISHWQHPRFFAYFPSNTAPESILAEFLMAGLGVNAMMWETSPAASELEEAMMGWLARACGLPRSWQGVIQSTASEATLCAVLMAREKATSYTTNQSGLADCPPLTIYCAADAHSSVEKAVKIAGLGRAALRLIPPKKRGAGMDFSLLAERVVSDRQRGMRPALLVATLGNTSTGGFDDLSHLADIADAHGMMLHVDAAWAGTATVCPEYRDWLAGVERVDSYVFNPHKWMGVQFDCSAHFVKDAERLERTLGIMPEYLKRASDTEQAEGFRVKDYRNWGVPLGRRARALKLWFTLRGQGLKAIRAMVRDHVAWAKRLEALVADTPGFEIVTSSNLSLFTFRYLDGRGKKKKADAFNAELVGRINDDGFTYLTKTVVKERIVLRWQIGPRTTTWDDIEASFRRVVELAEELKAEVATRPMDDDPEQF